MALLFDGCIMSIEVVVFSKVKIYHQLVGIAH